MRGVEMSAEEREDRLSAVLSEILADPQAAYRTDSVLYQEFLVRARMRRVTGPPMPMGEFRRRVAVARAGVDEETAASEGWQTALSLSVRVSDDLQGVFLLLAKAALRNEECPSDHRIARAYGTHSARRARRLLDLPAQDGLAFSPLVGTTLPQFIVLVDEIAHRGEAWSRDIILSTVHATPLRCEIRGRLIEDNPSFLLLTILDLEEMERHDRIAEAAELHRSGLLEWRRAQGFFSELERQNQLILNAAGEGIYGVNADGKTTFLNRAAQEMLGWTAEDLLGHDIHSVIHHHHLNGEVYPSHDCPIYQSFRFEQVARIEDEVFWRKDGKPIRVEYVSTPIYDQKVLAGAVVIFRDITERKENERKLREAMEEVAALRDRLKALTQELLSVDISKQQQSSDWGAADLTALHAAAPAFIGIFTFRHEICFPEPFAGLLVEGMDGRLGIENEYLAIRNDGRSGELSDAAGACAGIDRPEAIQRAGGRKVVIRVVSGTAGLRPVRVRVRLGQDDEFIGDGGVYLEGRTKLHDRETFAGQHRLVFGCENTRHAIAARQRAESESDHRHAQEGSAFARRNRHEFRRHRHYSVSAGAAGASGVVS